MFLDLAFLEKLIKNQIIEIVYSVKGPFWKFFESKNRVLDFLNVVWELFSSSLGIIFAS